jgi:hypothetical protein
MVVAVMSFLLPKKPKQDVKTPNYDHLRPTPLMTDNEREFYQRLREALPSFHIFPQVALSGIMQPVKGLSYADRMRIFGFFGQKRLDYVVCKQDTFEVVANIELDDRTHDKEKDSKRDKLLEVVGYKVYRYSSSKRPGVAEIAALFAEREIANDSQF